MRKRLAIVLITTAFTAGYLGLAILGWGGVSSFFAHPARASLAIALLALSGLASFSDGNLSSGVHEDRSNRWVLFPLTAIGLLIAFLPAYTDRMNLFILDGDFIRWCGVILFIGGSVLRLWPVFVLGHRFSGLVAIQPGHVLVTGSVYRFIRHPSYLGLLVGALGWGLAFRSGIGVLLAALLIPPLLARIRAEERLLRGHFGAEYDAYRARTWRLIPGVY